MQPPRRAAATLDLLPRREGRLLARVHRRYETMTEILRIGSAELRFTRIADPNRVLDLVAQEEDLRERLEGPKDDGSRPEPLHLPYWAELWDSAMGMCQLLLRGGLVGPGTSVLDLGCGMGLTGTVAASLGGRVLFADMESHALLFAAINSLPYQERVRLRRLNWREDDLGERFDLILGADILYEKSQWVFLNPFWRRHLAPGGQVLLGEPGRQTGELFVPWIKEHGWELNELHEPVETRSKPIRILCLRDTKTAARQ